VNEATGILVSSGEEDGAEDEEWEGIPDVDEIDREEEYVDEARYTTVTVESVDITKDGFARPGEGTDEDKVEAPIPTGREAQKLDVERRKKDKDNKVKKKIKKKKFRYEGKIERRLAGDKERSKNSKQAAARKENPTTRPARKEKAGKRRGGKK
jgi:ribosomal RNA-processing protein 17